MVIQTLIIALLPAASFAQVKGHTCWETLQTLGFNLSSNFGCVMERAKEHMASLCTEDGIGVSQAFRSYIILRGDYLATKAEADAWLAANPGASRYSQRIAANLKNAETAWMVAGNRSKIENQIEELRRQSVRCK